MLLEPLSTHLKLPYLSECVNINCYFVIEAPDFTLDENESPLAEVIEIPMIESRGLPRAVFVKFRVSLLAFHKL